MIHHALPLTNGMAFMAAQILLQGLNTPMDAAQAVPLWTLLEKAVPPVSTPDETAVSFGERVKAWEDAEFMVINLTEKQRDLLKTACTNLAGRFPVNRHTGKLAVQLGFGAD